MLSTRKNTKMNNWDLLQYLDEKGVDYRTHGKNVSRDSIGILCPECDDKSYHLNIHKDKKIFNCWRCGNRGNPVKLISMVEGVSYREALEILDKMTEGVVAYYSDEGIVGIVKGKLYVKKDDNICTVDKIELPGGCELIGDNPKMPYYRYLVDRGFEPSEFKTWEAYYCTKDSEHKDRIVFPIYLNKKLVAFQGRTIYNNKEPRYLSSHRHESVVNIKDTFYLYDDYNAGEEVVLVEGIFDALRLRSFGGRALAVFNMQLTDAQVELLMEKPPSLVTIMLDRGEHIMARRMWYELEGAGIRARVVDITKYKDPGSCHDKDYIMALVNSEEKDE